MEPSKASKESLKTPASGSAEKNVTILYKMNTFEMCIFEAQPTSEPVAATEMCLDLLKTEKFN